MRNKNRLIAVNTIFLYFRLLITLPISFYTSRVLLEELGVSDFGLYNAVAGIVLMFSTLRGAFASATQRFYNYAIGRKENSKLSLIFSTSFFIHLSICVILVSLIELFGFWFINNKLVFSPDRYDAVLYVFQFVVLSSACIIMQIPFDGLIIAKEKMNFYAYISIIDSLLKLLFVLFLSFVSVDKLILYSFFLFFISFIVFISTVIYCVNNFRDITLKYGLNKALFKEMSAFASWNLLGNVAYSLFNEGVNLLLNIFGGVVANAARGITYQVKNAMSLILVNSMTAVRPQATQDFANNNFTRFYSMIYTSSKFLFYIACMMVVPFLFYLNEILMFWLGKIPDYCCIFLTISFFHLLIRSYHEPLDVIFKSSGRMKEYQLVSIVVTFLVFPACYLLLKTTNELYMAFVVIFISEFLIWLFLLFLARKDGLILKDYLRKVILPSCCFLIFSCIVSFLISTNLREINFIVGIIVIGIILLGYIFLVGISKQERNLIKSIINGK